MPSVNISMHENHRIKSKIKDKMLKLARARHPDPEFETRLFEQLTLDTLDRYTELVNHELFKFVPTRTLESYVNYPRIKLSAGYPNNHKALAPFLYILDHDGGLIKFNEFSHIIGENEQDIKERIYRHPIMQSLKRDEPYILSIGQNELLPVHFTDESLRMIDLYNEKMEAEYKDFSTTMTTLMTTISNCRTTKQFEAKLPDLTSFYPDTIRDKISYKEQKLEMEKSTTQSEEEITLQNATNLVAASMMLDS